MPVPLFPANSAWPKSSQGLCSKKHLRSWPEKTNRGGLAEWQGVTPSRLTHDSGLRGFASVLAASQQGMRE